MDSQTKRTLAATALCLLLLFAWAQINLIMDPPKPPATTAQNTSTDAAPSTPVATDGEATTRSADGATIAAAPTSTELRAIAAESTEPVLLGSDVEPDAAHGVENPYRIVAKISPIGASIETVNLNEYHAQVERARDENGPNTYNLIRPLRDPKSGAIYRSFVTERLYLTELKKEISLADVPWKVTKTTDEAGDAVALSLTIKSGELDAVRLTKTYRLAKASQTIQISYDVENLSFKPQKVRISETGPTGLVREDIRYDHVRVVTAAIDGEGAVRLVEYPMRSEIYKAAEHKRDFTVDSDQHLLWSALSNKYFTCIVTPLALEGSKANHAGYLERLTARARIDNAEEESDLTTVQVYAPADAIAPGAKLTFKVEAYCGPKSERVFEAIPAAVSRKYALTMAADRSYCAFESVGMVMHWLLDFIYGIVGNFGVAIIMLVVIVRSILHPISKKGQINMMRMQKNMARIKPKLEALQEQYKNDKQKLAQEQFKLQREEGITPASQMLGCLPMFLQMPIWIALYTTLNTNVDLRHAPFFGYIHDLSAPDGLIIFDSQFSIPLISFMMGGPITALNLLPIIMTVLMYAQQKLTQKLTKPDKPPAPKLDKDGNPMPDMTAQQQKIMSFMMIFMGFLFYNMPSGLCLYILCSSFLGMCEQWYIRKHIKEQEIRGDFDAPKGEPAKPGPKKPPGWFQRKIEELQKAAEQQRVPHPKSPIPTRGKTKKKSRF